MAVDTQNKRRSVVFILPVPDSVIGQADRQQVARLYSGILAAIVVVASSARVYNVPAEDRIYEVPAKRETNISDEDRIYEVPT